MPSVRVERLPVHLFGLGRLGFDHLQIVFRDPAQRHDRQDDWLVIEGVREQQGPEARLAVEGWDGATSLSEANGGLSGEDLVRRIGSPASRGAQDIAVGGEAMPLWARLVSFAADIDMQAFPYIPVSLPNSPLPTINSSSLVASLLHHAGLAVADTLPAGLRLSPGLSTLLGTSGDDTLAAAHGFTTLAGGAGDDLLSGRDDAVSATKLYGGAGDDTLRGSRGANILHGGQPGLAYADDGHDTVDYSGAGAIHIEARPPGVPHLHPDFVVTHDGGRDFLFSIEEIVWDAARDRVTLGDGVGLAPPVDSRSDAERGHSTQRRLSSSDIALDLSFDADPFSELLDPGVPPGPAATPFGGVTLSPFDLIAGG